MLNARPGYHTLFPVMGEMIVVNVSEPHTSGFNVTFSDRICENRPLAINFTYQVIDTVVKLHLRCTLIRHIPYCSRVTRFKVPAPEKLF